MHHTLYFPLPGLDRVFDHALAAVFVAAAAVIHLRAVRDVTGCAAQPDVVVLVRVARQEIGLLGHMRIADVALQAHRILDLDLREGHAVIAAHVVDDRGGLLRAASALILQKAAVPAAWFSWVFCVLFITGFRPVWNSISPFLHTRSIALGQ